MDGVTAWCPDVFRAFKLRFLFWRGAVRHLGNAERQPAPLVAVAMQIRVKFKPLDWRQHVARWSISVYPTPRPHTAQPLMAIGKATNVAIDDTILDRIKAVMPSYHSQKAFINQLLDEAVTLREELTTRIKKSVAE